MSKNGHFYAIIGLSRYFDNIQKLPPSLLLKTSMILKFMKYLCRYFYAILYILK